jgi:hypothetical protein
MFVKSAQDRQRSLIQEGAVLVHSKLLHYTLFVIRQ